MGGSSGRGSLDAPFAPVVGDDGAVGSSAPGMLTARVERAFGTIAGYDMGLAALDDRECTPVTVIHVPGTGDTTESRDPDDPHGSVVPGLARDIAAELGDDARHLWLPYPADAYLSNSYADSSARGQQLLGELVAAVNEACPETALAFTGFSQGADIVDGWVETALAGNAVIGPDRIAAIAVLGNPRRGGDGGAPAVLHGTADPASIGMLGPRPGTWGPLADRVFDSCNKGDYWCEASPRMRELAPVIQRAAINPRYAGPTADAVAAFIGSRPVTDPETSEALGSLLRFLVGGMKDHLSYEKELDGQPSARSAAADFMVERLRPHTAS